MNIQLNKISLHYDYYSNSKVHQIYIEAHRGVNREFPENTLSAFNKSIFESFSWIIIIV